MSAVAESITETFANYKTIKVMDVLISSNVQGSTQKTWHKDNISPLCIDVDESNHETQQQTQSISVCQYAPLLQQVPYQLL